MIELVPTLSLADAWRLPARQALRLLAADAARRVPQPTPVDRAVGTSGLRHPPGMSRLIRALRGEEEP